MSNTGSIQADEGLLPPWTPEERAILEEKMSPLNPAGELKKESVQQMLENLSTYGIELD